MNAETIVAELRTMGSESIKKVLLRHGAVEPFYGVKVEDLKKIQKRVKKDHALALELYDTGISDAMYLAGLIAEPGKMTKSDLRKWAKNATWSMISEYTVAWTAAESPHGESLAKEWIESPKESIASSGWATFASLAAIRPDEELDLDLFAQLLGRVAMELPGAADRVRGTMNGYVIAVGCYVVPLAERARAVARALGEVEVDMGGTACKVPDAVEMIDKVIRRGSQGKKRKTAFC